MTQARITRSGQVTIPKEIRRKANLREGMTVFFDTDGEAVRMVPAILVPRDQAWFWTPEWQEKERQADREIRQGEGRTFRRAKDAARWLNRKRR